MRIFVVIKSTKHNRKVLENRGLFSDDSRYFFSMYEAVMSGQAYELKNKPDQISGS